MPLFAALAPRFLGFAPGIVALLGIAALRLSAGRSPAYSKFYVALVAGISGLGALSSLWSFDLPDVLRQSLGIFMILGSGAALFSLIGSLDKTEFENLRETFQRAFPFAMIIALLIVVADLYFKGFFYYLTRSSDTVFNSSRMNRGLVTLVFTAAPAFWALWDGPYKGVLRTTLISLILALLIAVLYKTQSQTAQLAAIIVIAFTFAFPYRCKITWGVLGAIIILALLGAPWIAQMMFADLARATEETSWLSQAYAADRMEIWDFVARRALEQPWYGFGLEACRYIEHFDTQKLYAPQEHILHPHNFALQIWLEFGALGAVLAAAAFGMLLKKIYNLGPVNARRVLPLFVAALAAAATSYGLWQAWWLGVFTLLPCLYLVARKEEA